MTDKDAIANINALLIVHEANVERLAGEECEGLPPDDLNESIARCTESREALLSYVRTALAAAQEREAKLREALRDVRYWMGISPRTMGDRASFKVACDKAESALSQSSHEQVRQAEQVGCEREDGLLNVHREDEYCEVCRHLAAPSGKEGK